MTVTHPVRRRGRALLTAAVGASASVTLAAILAVPSTAAPRSTPDSAQHVSARKDADPMDCSQPNAPRTFQYVEANLKSGTAIGKFKKDLAKVYKDNPDFVSLNEVPKRADSVIAPPGYALWRTPGQYTGATPIIWRTDKWTPLAHGTFNITNKPGYGKGQHVQWGIRYGNWTTLRDRLSCQVISVVTYHVAPISPNTKGLIGPSITSIGTLVRSLSAYGPVLTAGDLNRHYKSAAYPRARLTSYGMVPTYDIAGRYLPTGDHRGATIDYVFVNDASLFEVLNQRTRELNSDHDALVVDLQLLENKPTTPPVPTFSSGAIVNVPASALGMARRATVRQLIAGIRAAAPGTGLRLSTPALTDKLTAKALRKAYKRGVKVKFVSYRATPTKPERSLIRLFGSQKGTGSFALMRPKNAATAPVTSLMVNHVTAPVGLKGGPLLVNMDHPLNSTAMKQISRANTNTKKATVTKAVSRFAARSR